MIPQLSSSAKESLQAVLDKQAGYLGGAFLSVATADGVIFNSCSGFFDQLERGKQDARKASMSDVMWYASTTKLIIAVAYLQLVDRGILTLDTDMTQFDERLKKAASQRLVTFVDGKPIYEPNEVPIRLRDMLNNTSGFAAEMGPLYQQWRALPDNPRGFVLGCKLDSLVHKPITETPGTMFEYGNSADWLGLILPTITKEPVEDYLRRNVLDPLGMSDTTFFPFEWTDRLMPLRYGRGSEKGGEVVWEELTDQLPLLTIPRRKEDIEYCVGGGGIYSNTGNYIKLLHHLLVQRLFLLGQVSTRSPVTILSDESTNSLFQPSLTDSALHGMAAMLNRWFMQTEQEGLLEAGDANWGTAVAIYTPRDRRPRGGFGRRPNTIGWGGAAGTEFWIDPAAGIAVVWTTQQLPGAGNPTVLQAKKDIERAVYQAFGMDQ